ncbi:IS1595 family transposase [Thalassomonas haliotis]|uniref:IS1595 family transposase n=1 Tax=Thalassomonas haliotis TaxID=485448 RepID=A0ABY7VJ95_9GAMM|nr:IS1595 family transposase [Thalassomonas haliotis]WDE13536.1 IS1595 family transposase [Thalassomonas haliotis]
MNNSFEQLEQLTSQLDTEQKCLLINVLKGQVAGKNCLDVLTMHQDSAANCPHCHSLTIKRNGKVSGRQRYLCKSCNKSFMVTYNTPFYRLRNPEKWIGYLRCMLTSLTIRHSARECVMTKNTAFLWRHRFLHLLNIQSATCLSGIVEMDETLFRYSEKGSRHLTRKAHKRGKDKAGRGRAKGDWVAVLVARDRQKQTFDKRLVSASGESLFHLLDAHIDKDSVICSDGFRSYGVLTKKLGVTHKAINLTKGIRVIEKVFHIQNVNSYHGRLHNWMKRFHGVATRYLDNYLSWFRFFDSHEKPNENSLLLAQTQLIGT